jgi:tetratricopeptide (TPR) repeat protein
MPVPGSRFPRLAAGCFALAALAPLLAAAGWTHARSAHFELYTPAKPADAREALVFFENLLTNLERLTGARTDFSKPVRIIAFRSAEEFQPFSPNPMTVAYYLSGPERDHIVMRSIEAADRRVAVHEFTHLLLRRAGLDLPLWYNEGIADFYSTLRPAAEGKIRVGESLPGRQRALLEGRWLPLQELLAAGHDSPLYNESDRVGMLYAQSWALVHMLNVSPEYRGQLTRFLAALGRGRSSTAAFRQVYGKSLEEVTRDLAAHVTGGISYALEFEADWSSRQGAVKTASIAGLETGLLLGGLLAETGMRPEAYAHFAGLARRYPQSVEAQEALARLALASRDYRLAARHLERAVALGSTDARCYLYRGLLLEQAGARPAEVVPLLERALALDPGLECGPGSPRCVCLRSRAVRARHRLLGGDGRRSPGARLHHLPGLGSGPHPPRADR